MNKGGQACALFSPHGQIVLFSVPVALIGFPISLLVSFFAPDLHLPLGFTGRQLPLLPWAFVMFSVALAWFVDGIQMIFRDMDWKSPKAIVGRMGLLVLLVFFVLGGFLSSFVSDSSSLSDKQVGIGDFR
ncbi:MAG: hypothetical protein K2Y32_23500 [Candidatus Obscuribacterales bacterium]|nr:hypothetical protein [Candidatus Obscuribacterales bacterium]